MGFTCLRTIAEVLQILRPRPFPDDPIVLTFEEFLGGVKRLEDAGLPRADPGGGMAALQGWRVNYESPRTGLPSHGIPPGPWSGRAPSARHGDRRHAPPESVAREPAGRKG